MVLITHPNSPCRDCKYFRNGWCVLEVLDRFPQPLTEGAPCKDFERREEVSV